MRKALLTLWVKAQLLRDERGLDLIEYALVGALLAFAAIAGMTSVANGVTKDLRKTAATLCNYIN